MSILFEPKPIGKMIIKNRLVRSATVEKMATDDGHCTPKLLDLEFEAGIRGDSTKKENLVEGVESWTFTKR